MIGSLNFAVASLCTLIWISLAMPSSCEPLPMGNDHAPRTGRNKPFGSPDELRSYLDELGQYFAVVGRPRFGKRTLLPLLAGPSMKDPSNHRIGLGAAFPPLDSSDVYRLVYSPENDVS
ncbi:unnamed protein product [Bemisia tabaci]|uniref:Neuropeptide Y n=1 Tax=Bemisia tabaci TaxID=7038 RepID=A0A9P0A692_BEMTA|nr:PREDICTED: uncharacterized protein LOC109037295 [Bemisia tabaci]CAH0384814.1 unnamed protein product [Bemisia tabaci]